jgi:hypothetical protein
MNAAKRKIRAYQPGKRPPDQFEKSRAAAGKLPAWVFDGRILRKLAGEGFRTSQHANSFMVSFWCFSFAIRKSESKPSGTVLEKLMDPGENHRPFRI